MNLDSTSLIGLAVLGVGGYLVYTQMRAGGVDEEAANIQVPLTIDEAGALYEGVEKTWAEKLAGEPLENGDRIFRPLDTDAENPLRMYYAVTKIRKYRPNPGTPILLGGTSYPTVSEIYLFNTVTGREVRLDELARSTSMTNDARIAVEQTFANAFQHACRTFPRYLPWDNNITTAPMVDCAQRYPTAL